MTDSDVREQMYHLVNVTHECLDAYMDSEDTTVFALLGEMQDKAHEVLQRLAAKEGAER